MYINRFIEPKVIKSIANYPVTAILGPRQSGKSTLVKHILESIPNAISLDLERPSDLEKLKDAEWFLSAQKGKLIFLDEIQRKKEIFPLIRSLVDEWGGNSHFIITGSATRELLKQSSESLAGRISYYTLMPFIWDEIKTYSSLHDFLVKGGFPKSILQKDEILSLEWRYNFITTFLEKDLAFWSGFSTSTMRRLWQMLAHFNGQTLNYSSLGNSLGISHTTIRNYINLLESTYMIKMLPPFMGNTAKRLVKAPKIYLTDTGIINALLYQDNFEKIAGHPVFGSLWESIVLTHLISHFPKSLLSYYRTSNGAEIDFIMEIKGFTFSIECKNSLSPSITKGNRIAFNDLSSDMNFIVSPISQEWSIKPNINVASLESLVEKIETYTH